MDRGRIGSEPVEIREGCLYPEFETELADMAGVSRQSVHTHLDFFLAIGVMAPVEATSPRRYRFVPDSDVSRALVELDGAVNRAGASAE